MVIPNPATGSSAPDAADSTALTDDAAVESAGPWDFLTGDLAHDRRNARLLMETVHEVSTAVDPDTRMRRAVDRTIELTGAERGILFCAQDGAFLPHVARNAYGADLPRDLSYCRSAVDAVRECGGVFRQAVTTDAHVEDLSRSFSTMRLYSVMAARLDSEGEPLAILYLDDRTRPTEEFRESDERVFRAITGLITAAIVNIRLERESAERARLGRQVTLACAVQQSLLPQDIQSPPGFDLAGAGRVCEDMSGDYYDVINRPDGRIALVVADVSGHGLRSALHMVTTRALVRRLLGGDVAPIDMLDVLHEFLERDLGRAEFVTLFAGVLDPRDGRLEYANAGHCPPLLRQQDGTIHELGKTGPLLGILPDAHWRTAAPVHLAPGDVLFLYTDGLYEAHDPTDLRWGESNMRQALAQHIAAGRDARGVLDGVFGDLDEFRRDVPLEDDLTGLVVRRDALSGGS